ncbi:MAG: hypothetical protein V7K27_20040 [Nostoc sp.]|uniref:hypothetical protein n=1 Tax=Nostoc sp. TaxID=1180 RepID=UPI002FF51AEA
MVIKTEFRSQESEFSWVFCMTRSKRSYAVGEREACRRQASRTRVRLPLGEEKALRCAISSESESPTDGRGNASSL